MRNFAVVSRNTAGKNIEMVIDAFENMNRKDATLYVFSDLLRENNGLVRYMGWVAPKVIWEADFEFLILPMKAPETYSLVLHEGVKNGRKLIVNVNNTSLVSQLHGDYASFDSEVDLMALVSNLANGDVDIGTSHVYQRRSIWERLK